MALRFNGYSPTGATPWSAMCSTPIGNVSGSLSANANLVTLYGRGNRMNQRYAFGAWASNPPASEPPITWTLAEVGGDMATENTLNEGNTLTLTSLSLGKDLSCDLQQDGSITAAALSMIASLATDMQNEGQLTAPLQMTLNMASSMIQDGQVDAAMGLIAWMQVSMTQGNDMSASNLNGILSMAANIVSYGDLTPEGIRDAVWAAVKTSFNVAGTMGAVMNDLSSMPVQRGVALPNFAFVLVDSSDHVTPKTGATVTATRSIDGTAFAACANSVSEIGSGAYKISLASTDTDGEVILLKFTASGADTRFVTVITAA